MSNFPVTLEKTSEVLMSTYNKITSFPLSMGVNLKSKLRFIFSIILVLCFFANTSLYGETVGPSSASDGIGQDQLDTCSNIVPPKYKCGEKCVVIDGKEVWLEYCSKIGSIIDYVSFNHIHHASDYSVGSAASNCSPCGASALGSSAIESVQLQRYHRFRDMTEHSSFSPGVFQKYDISLRFAYEEVIKERQIYLFDPSTMARYVFIDENDDGVYLDPSHNSYKNITLYTGPDGTGAEISDYSQAQSAVLTTHNNHKWLFSLHNLSATAPAPWYDQDLGKPDYSGFAQWFNSTSGVLAGGGQLNNKKVDEGRSIYQGIDGDGALTVAVDGFTTPRGLDEERTKSSAQGMASIRAGLDAGSIMASVGIRKDGKVAFITRAGADADRETILITPATAATHVRIERAGTIISGFYSSDNANTWISAGNIDLSTLGSVAYFSFAATGDDKRVVTQVQFSDLAVTGNQAALASWPVQNGISPLSEAAATNGDWVGRLESQLDRNAYGINLTYKTWTTAELLAAPDRIWQLDTVADNNGRILTYHYHPNQIAGQWAVSSVDLPNGSSTVYAYANGQLSQVDHADGSQSTFTITDDAVSQCQIMQYDDAAAEGTHRRKSVYLSNNHREQRDSARTLYNNVINQSSMLVRLILNGEGEVAFLMQKAKQKGTWWRLIYEGSGRLRAQSMWSHGYYPAGKWSWDEASKKFVVPKDNNYHRPSLESTFKKRWVPGTGMSASKWSKDLLRLATPTVIDETGLKLKYTYNSADQKTKCTYPDGTFETWSYNENNILTRYRNRLGQVTKTTYDSHGNKTQKEVGLLEVDGVDVPQEAYAVYTWTYFPEGHQNKFLLSSETDANGNTTDYAYNEQNQLISVTAPADEAGGERPVTVYTYDSAGRQISGSDELGRTTLYSYDSRDRVTSITYTDGSVERFVYGTSGAHKNLLLKSTDRNGHVTSYTYDNHGRRTQKTTGTEIMDAAGEISAVADTSLRTDEHATYLNGTNDKVISTERSGEKTEKVYDYRHRLADTKVYVNTDTDLTSGEIYKNNLLFSSTDAYGRKTYYNYRDSDHKLIRTVVATVPSFSLSSYSEVAEAARDLTENAEYLITDYTLDAEGQKIAIIDPRGEVTAISYDARGRRTQIIEAAGTPVAAISETDYDGNSNIVAVRSPRYFDANDVEGYQKAETIMSYGGRNLLQTRTEAPNSAEAATEAFSYHLDARKASHTDFKGETTSYTWGTCCARFQGTIDPSGAATITRHNDRGDLTHQAVVSNYDGTVFPTFADPTNSSDIPDELTINEATTRYDALRRPVAMTVWLSPRGAIDANNPPIAGDDAPASEGLTTRYTYDDDLTDGVGLDATYVSEIADLHFGADSDGRAEAVTNPDNKTTVTVYDGLGRMVKTFGDNDDIPSETITYDNIVTVAGFGDVIETAIEDDQGFAIKQRKDGIGRDIQKVDIDNNVTNYKYDANANVIYTRKDDVVTQVRTYDALSREISNDGIELKYDANNNLISQSDVQGEGINNQYDVRGRQTQEGDVSHAYDANNNIVSSTNTGGDQVTYDYDSRNLLVQENYQQADGAVATQQTYIYDDARRITKHVANTVAGPDVSGTNDYAYDMANRPTSEEPIANYDPYKPLLNDDHWQVYNETSRPLANAGGVSPGIENPNDWLNQDKCIDANRWPLQNNRIPARFWLHGRAGRRFFAWPFRWNFLYRSSGRLRGLYINGSLCYFRNYRPAGYMSRIYGYYGLSNRYNRGYSGYNNRYASQRSCGTSYNNGGYNYNGYNNSGYNNGGLGLGGNDSGGGSGGGGQVIPVNVIPSSNNYTTAYVGKLYQFTVTFDEFYWDEYPFGWSTSNPRHTNPLVPIYLRKKGPWQYFRTRVGPVPNWLNVTGDGFYREFNNLNWPGSSTNSNFKKTKITLSGTPQPSDVGKNAVNVKPELFDSSNRYASKSFGPFNIVVVDALRGEDPQEKAIVGEPYQYVPIVNYPNGRFSIHSSAGDQLPDWLTQSFDTNTGEINGVPGPGDLGKTLAIVISLRESLNGPVVDSLPPFNLTVYPASYDPLPDVNLEATYGDGKVNLTWSFSSNVKGADPDLSDFDEVWLIKRLLNTNEVDEQRLNNKNQRWFSDVNVTNGEPIGYILQLRRVRGNLTKETSESIEVQGTPQAGAQPFVPHRVSSLHTWTDDSTAYLTWRHDPEVLVADNSIGYLIHRKEGGGNPLLVAAVPAEPNKTKYLYKDEELSPATDYEYTVTVIDHENRPSESQVINVTTASVDDTDSGLHVFEAKLKVDPDQSLPDSTPPDGASYVIAPSYIFDLDLNELGVSRWTGASVAPSASWRSYTDELHLPEHSVGAAGTSLTLTNLVGDENGSENLSLFQCIIPSNDVLSVHGRFQLSGSNPYNVGVTIFEFKPTYAATETIRCTLYQDKIVLGDRYAPFVHGGDVHDITIVKQLSDLKLYINGVAISLSSFGEKNISASAGRGSTSSSDVPFFRFGAKPHEANGNGMEMTWFAIEGETLLRIIPGVTDYLPTGTTMDLGGRPPQVTGLVTDTSSVDPGYVRATWSDVGASAYRVVIDELQGWEFFTTTTDVTIPIVMPVPYSMRVQAISRYGYRGLLCDPVSFITSPVVIPEMGSSDGIIEVFDLTRLSSLANVTLTGDWSRFPTSVYHNVPTVDALGQQKDYHIWSLEMTFANEAELVGAESILPEGSYVIPDNSVIPLRLHTKLGETIGMSVLPEQWNIGNGAPIPGAIGASEHTLRIINAGEGIGDCFIFLDGQLVARRNGIVLASYDMGGVQGAVNIKSAIFSLGSTATPEMEPISSEFSQSERVLELQAHTPSGVADTNMSLAWQNPAAEISTIKVTRKEWIAVAKQATTYYLPAHVLNTVGDFIPVTGVSLPRGGNPLNQVLHAQPLSALPHEERLNGGVGIAKTFGPDLPTGAPAYLPDFDLLTAGFPELPANWVLNETGVSDSLSIPHVFSSERRSFVLPNVAVRLGAELETASPEPNEGNPSSAYVREYLSLDRSQMAKSSEENWSVEAFYDLGNYTGTLISIIDNDDTVVAQIDATKTSLKINVPTETVIPYQDDGRAFDGDPLNDYLVLSADEARVSDALGSMSHIRVLVRQVRSDVAYEMDNGTHVIEVISNRSPGNPNSTARIIVDLGARYLDTLSLGNLEILSEDEEEKIAAPTLWNHITYATYETNLSSSHYNYQSILMHDGDITPLWTQYRVVDGIIGAVPIASEAYENGALINLLGSSPARDPGQTDEEYAQAGAVALKYGAPVAYDYWTMQLRAAGGASNASSVYLPAISFYDAEHGLLNISVTTKEHQTFRVIRTPQSFAIYTEGVGLSVLTANDPSFTGVSFSYELIPVTELTATPEYFLQLWSSSLSGLSVNAEMPHVMNAINDGNNDLFPIAPGLFTTPIAGTLDSTGRDNPDLHTYLFTPVSLEAQASSSKWYFNVTDVEDLDSMSFEEFSPSDQVIHEYLATGSYGVNFVADFDPKARGALVVIESTIGDDAPIVAPVQDIRFEGTADSIVLDWVPGGPVESYLVSLSDPKYGLIDIVGATDLTVPAGNLPLTVSIPAESRGRDLQLEVIAQLTIDGHIYKSEVVTATVTSLDSRSVDLDNGRQPEVTIIAGDRRADLIMSNHTEDLQGYVLWRNEPEGMSSVSPQIAAEPVKVLVKMGDGAVHYARQVALGASNGTYSRLQPAQLNALADLPADQLLVQDWPLEAEMFFFNPLMTSETSVRVPGIVNTDPNDGAYRITLDPYDDGLPTDPMSSNDPIPNLGSQDPLELGDESAHTNELPNLDANTVTYDIQPENENPTFNTDNVIITVEGDELKSIKTTLNNLTIAPWIKNNVDGTPLVMSHEQSGKASSINAPVISDRSLQTVNVVLLERNHELQNWTRSVVAGTEDHDDLPSPFNYNRDQRSVYLDPDFHFTAAESSSIWHAGRNTLVYDAKDADGAQTSRVFNTVIVDDQGPKIEIINPKPAIENVLANKLTIVGKYTDLTAIQSVVLEIKPRGAVGSGIKFGHMLPDDGSSYQLNSNQASVQNGLFYFDIPAEIGGETILSSGAYTLIIQMTDIVDNESEAQINFQYINSDVVLTTAAIENETVPGQVDVSVSIDGLNLPGAGGVELESLTINGRPTNVSVGAGDPEMGLVDYDADGVFQLTQYRGAIDQRVYYVEALVSFPNGSVDRIYKTYTDVAYFVPVSEAPQFISAVPADDSVFFTDTVAGTVATIATSDDTPVYYRYYDDAPGVDPAAVVIAVPSSAPEAVDGWLDITELFTVSGIEARLKAGASFALPISDPRVRISVTELPGIYDQKSAEFYVHYQIIDRINKTKPIISSRTPFVVPYGVPTDVVIKGFNLSESNTLILEGMGAEPYTLSVPITLVVQGNEDNGIADLTLVRVAPPSPGVARFVLNGVPMDFQKILVADEQDHNRVARRLALVTDRDGNDRINYNDVVDEDGLSLLPPIPSIYTPPPPSTDPDVNPFLDLRARFPGNGVDDLEGGDERIIISNPLPGVSHSRVSKSSAVVLSGMVPQSAYRVEVIYGNQREVVALQPSSEYENPDSPLEFISRNIVVPQEDIDQSASGEFTFKVKVFLPSLTEFAEVIERNITVLIDQEPPQIQFDMAQDSKEVLNILGYRSLYKELAVDNKPRSQSAYKRLAGRISDANPIDRRTLSIRLDNREVAADIFNIEESNGGRVIFFALPNLKKLSIYDHWKNSPDKVSDLLTPEELVYGVHFLQITATDIAGRTTSHEAYFNFNRGEPLFVDFNNTISLPNVSGTQIEEQGLTDLVTHWHNPHENKSPTPFGLGTEFVEVNVSDYENDEESVDYKNAKYGPEVIVDTASDPWVITGPTPPSVSGKARVLLGKPGPDTTIPMAYNGGAIERLSELNSDDWNISIYAIAPYADGHSQTFTESDPPVERDGYTETTTRTYEVRLSVDAPVREFDLSEKIKSSDDTFELLAAEIGVSIRLSDRDDDDDDDREDGSPGTGAGNGILVGENIVKKQNDVGDPDDHDRDFDLSDLFNFRFGPGNLDRWPNGDDKNGNGADEEKDPTQQTITGHYLRPKNIINYRDIAQVGLKVTSGDRTPQDAGPIVRPNSNVLVQRTTEGKGRGFSYDVGDNEATLIPVFPPIDGAVDEDYYEESSPGGSRYYSFSWDKEWKLYVEGFALGQARDQLKRWGPDEHENYFVPITIPHARIEIDPRTLRINQPEEADSDQPATFDFDIIIYEPLAFYAENNTLAKPTIEVSSVQSGERYSDPAVSAEEIRNLVVSNEYSERFQGELIRAQVRGATVERGANAFAISVTNQLGYKTDTVYTAVLGDEDGRESTVADLYLLEEGAEATPGQFQEGPYIQRIYGEFTKPTASVTTNSSSTPSIQLKRNGRFGRFERPIFVIDEYPLSSGEVPSSYRSGNWPVLQSVPTNTIELSHGAKQKAYLHVEGLAFKQGSATHALRARKAPTSGEAEPLVLSVAMRQSCEIEPPAKLTVLSVTGSPIELGPAAVDGVLEIELPTVRDIWPEDKGDASSDKLGKAYESAQIVLVSSFDDGNKNDRYRLVGGVHQLRVNLGETLIATIGTAGVEPDSAMQSPCATFMRSYARVVPTPDRIIPEAASGVTPIAGRGLPVPWMDVSVEVPLHSRQLKVNHTNFQIPGRMLDAIVGQTYRSGDYSSSFLGRGWHANWNQHFIDYEGEEGESIPEGSLLFVGPDGRTDIFKAQGETEFIIPPGYTCSLERQSHGGLLMRHSDGSQTQFKVFGTNKRYRLIKHLDKYENALTFDYDNDSGLLNKMIDDMGREYVFIFVENQNGEGVVLDKVRDHDVLEYDYEYELTANRLKSISVKVKEEALAENGSKHPKAGETLTYVSYSYAADSAGNLTAISIAEDANYCTVTYETGDDSFRVRDLEYGLGKELKETMIGSEAVSHFDTTGVETNYTFESDAARQMLPVQAQVNPAGLLTTYVYDEEQRLKEVTHPMGDKTNYVYERSTPQTDKRGFENVLTITQSSGTYPDPSGGVAENSVTPLTTTMQYEGADKYYQMKSSTTPDNVTTTYTYSDDEIANLIEVKVPDQSGLDAITQYAYNKYGQVSTMLEADQSVTYYTYYQGNDVANQAENDGEKPTQASADREGYLASVTESIGNINKGTASFELVAGDAKEEIALLGDEQHTTSFSYDAYGRVVSETSPKGATTSITYNLLGQMRQVLEPPQYGDDTANGETRVKKTIAYTLRGLPEETITYNPVATLSETGDPVYAYSETPAKSNYVYDTVDRVTSMTQSNQEDGGTTIYNYMPGLDRLKYVRDMKGAYTIYMYDYIGRVESVWRNMESYRALPALYPQGKTEYGEQYTYNDSDEIIAVRKFYGRDTGGWYTLSADQPETSITRDWLGRAVRVVQNPSTLVRYQQYNEKGQLKKEYVQYEAGAGSSTRIAESEYLYNSASGQIEQVKNHKTAGISQFYQSQTDAEMYTITPERLEQIQKANGAGQTFLAYSGRGGTDGYWTARAFDRDSNVLAASSGFNESTALSHLGNIVEVAAHPEYVYNGTAPAQLYNMAGNVIKTLQPELGISAVTEIWPSGYGAPGLVKDADGKIRRQIIDEMGNPTVTTEAFGLTDKERSTYTIMSRSSRQKAIFRYVQSRGSDGAVVEVVQATRQKMDLAGRRVQQQIYYNVPVHIEFEGGTPGKLAILDAQTPSFNETWVYDELGRFQQHNRKDGTRIRYEYYPDDAANVYARRQLKSICMVDIDDACELLMRELKGYNEFGKATEFTEHFGHDEETGVPSGFVRTWHRYKRTTGAGYGQVVSETTQVFNATAKNDAGEDYAINSHAVTVAYTYDLDGKRLTCQYPGASVADTSTAAGMDGRVVYDEPGADVRHLPAANGHTITYEYDAEQFLTKATRDDELVVYDYTLGDNFPHVENRKLWNNAVELTTHFSDGPRSYQHSGLVTKIIANSLSDAVVVENAFEHRGLKQSMSEWPVPEASAYTRTFGYDAYRRVESMFPSIHDRWGRDTVTLDEMENRKFAEIDGQIFRYQTVSANQYLNFEPPTNNDRAYEVVKYDGTGSIPHATGDGNEGAFTYDDRGYLTSDRLFTYSWDAFNRLSTVEVTHSSEDAQVTYLYDAMGRRVARLYTAFDYDDWWWLKYASIQSVVISPILGNLEDGQSVHVYELHAYSGKQLIEERSFNADRVAKRNYFGPALNQVIATEHIDNTGTATAYVAITDEQGSLMGVTDDSGDLKERFSYNSTGLMKQIDVDEFYEGPKYESAYIPFAWHGMYKERLTGKLHTHYRDYDPFHGRWLSEDPMGMMDGMNLYAAYMGPNGIDPEGGAIVSGTLAAIGIYTAVQASFAAAETVVEYGMHRAMGSEGDFLGGSTFLKNFGINMATGGIGGKAKLSWKFANASLANQGVKSFGYRFGLEVAAESAYDVHFRGQSAGSSLAINTIGGIAGEGIARLIGAGFNSAKNAIKRSIDDITDGIDLSRGIGRSSSQVKHVNDIAYALYDGGSGYRRWHRMSSYETLRKEFNNSARAQYIKHFATTERAAKMFTENELRKMARRGVMPTGYVVHHLKPLYRGGDNAFNNLRVMTEAFHIKHGSKLHYYTQGSNPYGRN